MPHRWSEWLPEYLDPTPDELRRVIAAATRLGHSLGEYKATLAGKKAKDIVDGRARESLLGIVRSTADLICGTVPLLDDSPEIAHWPDVLGMREHLCELYWCVRTLTTKLTDAIPQLPDVDGCRWWLVTGKKRELVASWYLPDLAETIADGYSPDWSLGFDVAHNTVRKTLNNETDKSPSEALAGYVEEFQQSGLGGEHIYWHIVNRQERAERNELPVDLPEEWEFQEIELRQSFTWPRVESSVADLLSEWLEQLTCATIRDEFEPRTRTLRIPVDDLPYPTADRDWQFKYPMRTYVRNPWEWTQEIETLTRTRLRDGENPLWFIHIYNQFVESERDKQVSFAELCIRMHPRRVDILIEESRDRVAGYVVTRPVEDVVGNKGPDSSCADALLLSLDVQILKVLQERGGMPQVEIRENLKKHRRSRKVIGNRVKHLKDLGFVSPPPGRKYFVSITDKGLSWLREHENDS